MFDQASIERVAACGDENIPGWLRLHREMKSATRRRCAWDAEHARHLREAEAAQLWNHFGHISILEYLEREHGIEPRVAGDRLRVSHALGELPMLEANLEDGTFQYSHVRELTRVVTPETEEEWIAAARGKTCKEVQEMVAGHKKGDGPDDPEDPDLRLRMMMVMMTPQMVAMLHERRAELEAEMGHRLNEMELWRIVLERSGAGGEGLRAPAQISICAHCDRGWQNGAELEPAEIARALCDADHLGSVDDATPGHKKPTLSAKKRQRILARDKHRCAVPGCRSRRHLEIHHIDPQEDGGGHEDENLVILCSGHHRMRHAGKLGIEGRAPDAITFVWKNDVQTHVGARESTYRAEPAERRQARDALVGLGWKSAIAAAAVDEAWAHAGEDLELGVLIREALRRCPRPTS